MFLSYARGPHDREVESVAAHLRGDGCEVFFDRDSMSGGSPVAATLRSQIENSDLFVFLVSPDSLRNESYALTELGWAKDRWPDPAGHVLPVLVEPVAADSVDPYLDLVNRLEIRGSFVVGVCDAVKRLLFRHGPGQRLTHLLGRMSSSARMRQVVGRDLEDHMAVDDGLLFEPAPLPQGWLNDQISLNIGEPFQVPEGVRRIAQRHRARLRPPNKTKLSVIGVENLLKDQRSGEIALRLRLAPISFYDIVGVELSLDDSPGTAGGRTLREQHFREHAVFGWTNGPQLPSKLVVHVLVVTADQKFLIMRRSRRVQFQNAQWSASFEEQMQGSSPDGDEETPDRDLRDVVMRGCREELGFTMDGSTLTFLGLCSEYDNLAYGMLAVVRANLPARDIVSSWKLFAPDKGEHDRLVALPFERDVVCELLARDTGVEVQSEDIRGESWHPTARLRILLGAIHLGLLP